MTNKTFRKVFLFITEGLTDLDILRILLFCKLRSEKVPHLESPIDEENIIKYLSDVVRIAPGSAFVGTLLRYSIAANDETRKVEVLALLMPTPYVIEKGYNGIIKTILYYTYSKVLEKRKILNPLVETEYRIVGVIDIDVLEEKPWKPEHVKNIRKNLYDLISRAKPSEVIEDVKVDVILTGSDSHPRLGKIPRLVKLRVGNASAYLLFWGACRDRKFYKGVEDVEATLLDVIAERLQPQNEGEVDLKDAAERLSRILPRECTESDYVHKYKACVVNDYGAAPLNLVSPLHLLAYSVGKYGKKHPNELWKEEEGTLRKAIEEQRNATICKELLERCELDKALDYILQGV